MKDEKKIIGTKRRELILQWLKEQQTPITGGELAERTNVSRQVIVQDVSLLKAKKEPIIATSQGYMYMGSEEDSNKLLTRVIACQHKPEDTRKELYIIVDHGVKVRDVRIEHPVYGDLTASIMVSTRKEADQFIEKVNATNAAYLSQLTDGTHLHTLEADSEEKLNDTCNDLKEAGLLIDY